MQKSYSLVTRQTLMALRGHLSQEQVNRKLKMSSNQVARWESGHSRITWNAFCEFSKVTKAPIAKAIKDHLFFDGEISDQRCFLQSFGRFFTQKHLAEQLNVSQSLVSRMLNGSTDITLDLVFRIVDLSPYSLTDFVSTLTWPNVPSSILAEQVRIDSEKKLHFSHPWTAALVLYLKTTEYKALKKHSNFFLAARVGVPEAAVRKGIAELTRLKVIAKKGQHYEALSTHLSMGGSFEGAKNIRMYWLDRSLKYIAASKSGKTVYSGYKIFNVGEMQRKKFEDFYFRMNAELDMLIKDQSTKSEEVFLFSFQMFDVAALSSGESQKTLQN